MVKTPVYAGNSKNRREGVIKHRPAVLFMTADLPQIRSQVLCTAGIWRIMILRAIKNERIDIVDEIKQIYSSDSYSAFLNYCELHDYKRMRDLKNCRFEELLAHTDITPALLSRIKSIFVLYLKKYPGCLSDAKPAPAKTVRTDDLNKRLLTVFEQHVDKLIHISDLTKAVGKSTKRSDILETLSRQPWCRMVDQTTFFYVPPQQ